MTKDITPKPHETDIRTLIDRYMSGDTTNEEETTLRTWFRLAGDDMPEEWRPLRALFSFVDEERETRKTDDATAPRRITACSAPPTHLDFVGGGCSSRRHRDACAAD